MQDRVSVYERRRVSRPLVRFSPRDAGSGSRQKGGWVDWGSGLEAGAKPELEVLKPKGANLRAEVGRFLLNSQLKNDIIA